MLGQKTKKKAAEHLTSTLEHNQARTAREQSKSPFKGDESADTPKRVNKLSKLEKLTKKGKNQMKAAMSLAKDGVG